MVKPYRILKAKGLPLLASNLCKEVNKVNLNDSKQKKIAKKFPT